MYHLNVISHLKRATMIYYKYHYAFDDYNLYLQKLSSSCYDELYDEKVPEIKNCRYYIGKLIIGKVGTILFENYARYMYCGTIDAELDYERYLDVYAKLPRSYQRLLDN